MFLVGLSLPVTARLFSNESTGGLLYCSYQDCRKVWTEIDFCLEDDCATANHQTFSYLGFLHTSELERIPSFDLFIAGCDGVDSSSKLASVRVGVNQHLCSYRLFAIDSLMTTRPYIRMQPSRRPWRWGAAIITLSIFAPWLLPFGLHYIACLMRVVHQIQLVV
jgi:hypothetical protein